MNIKITFANKLMLKKDDTVFFGPGVAELLEDIEETGSVRNASEKMGLSYSKAWMMIRNASAGLGAEIVNRTKGGIGGGGSATLTEAGKDILARYRSFEADCNKEIGILFGRYFNAER